MLEATEEILKNSLQSIFSYASISIQALWNALSNPENIPVFLSSLVKFSLGPTLAFTFSQWSFKRQEEKNKELEKEDRDKRKQSIRLMIILEILHNISALENTKKSFENEMVKLEEGETKDVLGLVSFFRALDAFSTLRDRFLSMDILLISNSFSAKEIHSLNELYSTLEGIKTGIFEIRRLDVEIREKAGMEFPGIEHLKNVSLIFQRGIDKGRNAITVLSEDET